MPYPDAKYPYDQQLVKAAPDLLDALKHAEQFIRLVYGYSADFYLEAISMAEGRSE